MPDIPFLCTAAQENNIQISVFDIESIEPIRELLDSYICSICEGCSATDLVAIKTRLKNRFQDKTDARWKMGAVAEFFIHLYMNINGYKQECLFLNLEEGSIKKGFDGF